jgi:hypothetical protein
MSTLDADSFFKPITTHALFKVSLGSVSWSAAGNTRLKLPHSTRHFAKSCQHILLSVCARSVRCQYGRNSASPAESPIREGGARPPLASPLASGSAASTHFTPLQREPPAVGCNPPTPMSRVRGQFQTISPRQTALLSQAWRADSPIPCRTRVSQQALFLCQGHSSRSNRPVHSESHWLIPGHLRCRDREGSAARDRTAPHRPDACRH